MSAVYIFARTLVGEHVWVLPNIARADICRISRISIGWPEKDPAPMPDTRRSASSEISDITLKFRGPASEILDMHGCCPAMRY
jgi:hypothetical protein